MITITLLLALTSFLCTIASAMGKAPLWVSVLLLNVIVFLQILPR